MIAALGLLLGACNRQATAKTPKTDLDRLQGTWNLVSAIQDGNALPEDKVKQTTIVFKGDTFRFPGSAEYATSRAGTIKLDETKTPKEMDAISTEKEVMLGIYALEENGYKVCFAPAGKPRPTEFTSTPRSGQILQVWQRQNRQ
ncbi:MAG TPA: TIGR03067 domain-containing protein [Bryobacteraceae bacterium]|nr:TIGR03067 domain-containing protein [Bryobacteraceae bacterium]